MSKSLVVVESPAKARTIAGFLGDKYEVLASVGHIRDLPRNESELPEGMRPTHGRLAGIAPDQQFDAIYVISPDKKDVIKQLKAALKDASELILATDEDREGEAISWHIVDVLKPNVPIKRMVFHEITKSAITEALAHPRELHMKLVRAQEGRRILDRIVGWETSPVLWRKIGRFARSAGRVQSVAVRMVVERERARMSFRSGAWAGIEGILLKDELPFGVSLVELDGVRIAEGRDFDPNTGAVLPDRKVVVLDESTANGLVSRLEKSTFSVLSVESRPFTEKPKAPFTTSTLQQEASRKLRYPAAKTMAVAQRLYERGYITYMRTDSTNLSEQAISAARAAIEGLFGKNFLPDAARTYKGKVKNAQEAHEAIRAAGERIRPPDEVRPELDADEMKLYELVWIRTIACQMVDAKGRNTSIKVGATSSSKEAVILRASGRTYDFLGYRRAYVEDDDEEDDKDSEHQAVLPPLAQGDVVTKKEMTASNHETKPPARYTEASLVKELEERGIGRPSTYASVIQTIQAREYVWKKGTALVPAWVAFAVTKLLEEHFGHLVDYGFTAAMEEELDAVARDEHDVTKWLSSFYFGNGKPGLRTLVADENLAKIDPRAVSEIPIGRDKEGKEIVARVGRYGPYVQRMAEAEQRASIPPDMAPDELTVESALALLARQAEGPRTLGTDPASGLVVYVLDGRFGPYIQLGEMPDDKKSAKAAEKEEESGEKKPKVKAKKKPKAKDIAKPKRASLFKAMTPQTVTLEQALQLLSLPRAVGEDADKLSIVAKPGRFGPYLERSDGQTRSLENDEQLFSVSIAEAVGLFAQPKQRRGKGTPKAPLAEFGLSPDTGKLIRVLDGRFGPYVTDGETNANIPRGTDPTALTVEEALSLLRARAAAPRPAKPGRRAAAKPKPKAKPKEAAAKKTKAKAGEDASDGSGEAESSPKKKVAPKSAGARKKATAKPGAEPKGEGKAPRKRGTKASKTDGEPAARE